MVKTKTVAGIYEDGILSDEEAEELQSAIADPLKQIDSNI